MEVKEELRGIDGSSPMRPGQSVVKLNKLQKKMVRRYPRENKGALVLCMLGKNTQKPMRTSGIFLKEPPLKGSTKHSTVSKSAVE